MKEWKMKEVDSRIPQIFADSKAFNLRSSAQSADISLLFGV
jgi:hypothetical protein